VVQELANPADLLSAALPNLDVTYSGKVLEASKNILGIFLEWKTCGPNKLVTCDEISLIVGVIQQRNRQQPGVLAQFGKRFVLPKLWLDGSYSWHRSSSARWAQFRLSLNRFGLQNGTAVIAGVCVLVALPAKVHKVFRRVKVSPSAIADVVKIDRQPKASR
jgi:hypothetical protein